MTSPDPGVPDFLKLSTNTDPYGLGDLGNQTIVLSGPMSGAPLRIPGVGKRPRPGQPTQGQSTTASNYFSSFVGMSQTDKGSYSAIQQALYDAGYYGSSKPMSGTYSAADRQAMLRAIQDYSDVQKTAPGLSFQDYLKQVASGVAGAGGPTGPTRAPLSLTDPATLRQSVQAAARSALGRKLSDDELAKFVNNFHGKEKAAYDSAGDNQTYTNPDASGEALEFVDNRHSQEEQDASKASYIDRMNSLLGVL